MGVAARMIVIMARFPLDRKTGEAYGIDHVRRRGRSQWDAACRDWQACEPGVYQLGQFEAAVRRDPSRHVEVEDAYPFQCKWQIEWCSSCSDGAVRDAHQIGPSRHQIEWDCACRHRQASELERTLFRFEDVWDDTRQHGQTYENGPPKVSRTIYGPTVPCRIIYNSA